MKLSYTWLSELCDIPVSAEALVDVLTYLGLEVEAMKSYRATLDHVVIGEVLESAHIEGSDHLSLTQTNVGGEVRQIVCGAPNVAAGQRVAVMLPGGVTAEGMHIKKAKLRGYDSNGMICSERELGLIDEHEGILVGGADWQVGAPASKYLNFNDTIYDVEITPNRPDFLSHIGVARDLAAKFKVEWRWPAYGISESDRPAASRFGIRVDAPDGCPRYAARVVEGLEVRPAPYATRLRLARCGIRPISNIVDATNLLMLEFGQPLHAFDAHFIRGNEIRVRYASEGEDFVTLDGKARKLRSSDVVIADREGGIALAGVMGGANSEIRNDTTEVVIESAFFDPVHVRRTSKSLGLSTDSSRRFERGCDPNGVPRVVDAAAALMRLWGGGEICSGVIDAYPKPISGNHILFRPKRAISVVGLEIERGEMRDILHRLGCEIEGVAEPWRVDTPTYRPDLKNEIDLIEEVIRVHGYETIPTGRSSRIPLAGHDEPTYQLRRKIVDIMVGLGFQETLSVSMYTPDERRDPPGVRKGVQIDNPVTDDMRHLQGSLLPQMLKSVAANWLRGDKTLRLFEVARVFHESPSEDPRSWERLTLASILTGSTDPWGWSRKPQPLDFYDLKAAIEILATRLSLDNLMINCYDTEDSGVGGQIMAGTGCAGYWGIWTSETMALCDVDAPVAWFEMDIGSLLATTGSRTRYQPLPKFPISWRDIAVVVDSGVTSGQLIASASAVTGGYLVNAVPFDVYSGERLGAGKKSVAIRLEFSHPDRSLESAEVDDWIDKIVSSLRANHGAELRGG